MVHIIRQGDRVYPRCSRPVIYSENEEYYSKTGKQQIAMQMIWYLPERIEWAYRPDGGKNDSVVTNLQEINREGAITTKWGWEETENYSIARRGK